MWIWESAREENKMNRVVDEGKGVEKERDGKESRRGGVGGGWGKRGEKPREGEK